MYFFKFIVNDCEGSLNVREEDLSSTLDVLLDKKGLKCVELYYNGNRCTLPDWFENTVMLRNKK